MIKSVTVMNDAGESIRMELGHPEDSGFLIQKITGLGPPKAEIHSTSSATNDGSTVNSVRLGDRNIVIYLKLMVKPTVEDMRQLSYKYFPIKKHIQLMFETDNRLCITEGRVETNEPDIFSDQETTQISIVCPDPYFYSVDQNITVFSGTESLFEFPFYNESVSENLMEFGNVKSDMAQEIIYPGDSEIGFVATIHALGVATNLTIYNILTREAIKIDTTKLQTLTGSGIIAGDDIIISTVKGHKYVILLRNGVYTNILNCINRDVNWLQLSQDKNVFAYTADTGVMNLEFKIVNQIVYEGI